MGEKITDTAKASKGILLFPTLSKVQVGSAQNWLKFETAVLTFSPHLKCISCTTAGGAQ